MCYDSFRTNVLKDRRITMLIQEQLSIKEKLEILSDAAKYDVACTSSGVDRR